MTVRRNFKNIIRERKAKTGESYTTARAHVIREHAPALAVGTAVERPLGGGGGIRGDPRVVHDVVGQRGAVELLVGDRDIAGESERRCART